MSRCRPARLQLAYRRSRSTGSHGSPGIGRNTVRTTQQRNVDFISRQCRFYIMGTVKKCSHVRAGVPETKTVTRTPLNHPLGGVRCYEIDISEIRELSYAQCGSKGGKSCEGSLPSASYCSLRGRLRFLVRPP